MYDLEFLTLIIITPVMKLALHDTLYYYADTKSGYTQKTTKVAAFDFDYTIAYPKSGAKFAKDGSDWALKFPNVFDVLRKYSDDGYKLVIFTNQLGITKKKTKVEDLQEKYQQIRDQLDRPFDVYVASNEDYYRKPHTGMWDFFLSQYPNIKVDYKNSFYCGDAAGRPKNWKSGAVKDFSRSDMYFANNTKLPFRVPEQIFGDMSVNPSTPIHSTDPYNEINWTQYIKEPTTISVASSSSQPEMIIMVGTAASGKSTYTDSYVKQGYVHVNMDTLKTKAKCLKKAKEAVAQGKNVLIDNTNPSVEARKEYLDIAKGPTVSSANGQNYYCTALEMTTPPNICQHLNYLRVQKTKGAVRRVPQVAYNIFKSKFVAPQTEEGFDRVMKVDFCLSPTNASDSEFNYSYDIK